MTKEEIKVLFKKNQETISSLKVKRTEKRMYELRKQGKEEKEPKIISIYQEHIKSSNITDQTGNIAIKRIDEINDLTLKIKALEMEIAELEHKEAEQDKILSCLSYKEKVVLKARIFNPEFDLEEIGNISYYEVFRETRGREVIRRLLKSAYKKLEKIIE